MLNLILAIEGAASIGMQFLVMRLTTPYVGSSVVPTSVIITTILLFLSLGYRSGGRYGFDAKKRITKNLLFSALLIAVGLSEIVVSAILSPWGLPASLGVSTFVLFPAYLLIFIAPSAYLLAQIIPLVISLNQTSDQADKKAGDSYFYSTIGNVVGGLFLTLFVLYFFGSAVATIFVSTLLIVAALLINLQGKQSIVSMLFIFFTAMTLNHFGIYPKLMDNSRYADRNVFSSDWGTHLVINGSNSSGYREDGTFFEYIEHIRANHLKPGMKVAVLGAGGFTLGHHLNSIDFTYVDVDSKLKEFAETMFLGEPINGSFIAQDARVFLNTTKNKFDLVVVDVFGSGISIPEHLKTVEFYQDIIRVLKEDGHVVLNVIHNNTPKHYDHAMARSIHAALGFCTVQRTDTLGTEALNYIYDCQPTSSIPAFTDSRVSLFNSPGGL